MKYVNRIPIVIRPENCSAIELIYSSSSAADAKGCLDLSSRCCVVGVNRSLIRHCLHLTSKNIWTVPAT